MNILKTILYMGIMHGLFTIYLPSQLAFQPPHFWFGSISYLAYPCWAIGTLVIVQCSIDIIRRGQGTPAHLDPPRHLVITGWYRHVRNPIYSGALLIQAGFILWSGSVWVMVYAAFFFLAFHILVVAVEEPILRNNFDAEYRDYCNNVPRWIPRLF